ncbi:MAG TPA: QueT transporter family protein [bacterium]
MKPRARMLAEIGIVAAVYAVLTWVLAPISYGPLQLRVAEILKSLVIWEPHLIAAFVIGNFLSNLTSPFAGPWELIFMPFANLAGATLCYVIGRRQVYSGAAAYALVIGAAVSVVLSVVLQVRFGILFPGLLASEAILIIGGVPIMRALLRTLEPLRRRWLSPGRQGSG